MASKEIGPLRPEIVLEILVQVFSDPAAVGGFGARDAATITWKPSPASTAQIEGGDSLYFFW
ncbi:MAG: hypothetical protein MZU95_17215 [Desulfomicrobium escambiense]|nr:hypothetical protein [Desulfomicrobium escambiense]